ncbi:FimV/HubP family polar landmark protein, partial [Ramlibacter sp. 2FC]|uniref:FimV/HubP family polar landmark protein n=1 Tax=Ramlibacter sp. 2FC TaxID=2502188 RepID=UPI0024C219AC
PPPPAPIQAAAAGLGLDFVAPSLSPVAPPPAAVPDLLPELDLDLPAAAPALSPAPAAAAAAPGPASNMIEFDLDTLSLDLPPAVPDAATEASEDDPLATKLALAQEFHAIGDTDGARTLVKEVVAEASGSLKSRAERFLAELA